MQFDYTLINRPFPKRLPSDMILIMLNDPGRLGRGRCMIKDIRIVLLEMKESSGKIYDY
jgi:hypothetical protein